MIWYKFMLKHKDHLYGNLIEENFPVSDFNYTDEEWNELNEDEQKEILDRELEIWKDEVITDEWRNLDE